MNATVEEVLRRNGFEKYGTVSVDTISLHKSLYDTCSTNQCGMFNTNWSCPPGVGAYEDLVVRFKQFDQALVVQSIWTIADSYDIEGMLEAAQKHNGMLRSMVDELCPLIESPRTLILSVGACSLCKECCYVHGKPCPTPDRAFGALEAYGVDVAAVLGSCGLKYNNGPNTVSYVGMILY